MSRPRKHDSGLPAYVRIRHGSYVYRDQKLCRVEDGESKMYDALAKLKQGMIDGDSIPVAVAAFKLEYLPTLSPSFCDVAELLLDAFSKEFRQFTVEQVTPVLIRKSTKNLYAGKPAMALSYKSRISRFFRWCVDEAGLRADNPCREVWLPKPPKYKTPWTDALFWAVRDKLSPMKQCYHDLSFLLYQRTTDVRLLMHSDIRGDIIHFEPSKTVNSSGLEVDIPITPEIRAVLDRAKKLAKLQPLPGGDAPVIQTSAGTTFSRGAIYTAYRRADAALHGKVPIGLNPKALRPYALTWAKKHGYSIGQLKVGAAHTTERTTEGYIHQHEVPVSEVALTLPDRPKG